MKWLNAFKDKDIQITTKDIQSWILSSALAFKISIEPDLTIQEDLEDTFFDFKDDAEVYVSVNTPTRPQSTGNFQNQFEFLKYLNDKKTNVSMLNNYNFVKQIFLKYNCI